jgi:hypothetical protein
MRAMSVPEQVRQALSRWCAAQIPEAERERHRIGYTIQGPDVTIHDRRAPTYPELGAEWTSTPLARLRLAGDGTWSLLRPGTGGRWGLQDTGADPLVLLGRVSTGRPPA